MSSTQVTVLLALGLGLASSPAFAHAHLLSATPADNATVSRAPNELRLTFSEGVNLKFTGATLLGSGGAPVATGEATLDSTNDKVLIVPVPASLAAGAYTVEWHALATDGHKTQGRYGFTLKP